MQQSPFRWNPVSFILHTLIALSVITQLISSQVMERTQGTIHIFAFSIHLTSGITALICATLFLLWKWVGPYGGLQRLFPWLSARGCKDIWQDLQLLAQRRIPRRSGGGLAGTIHGLGLLLVLCMAALGVIWYIGWHFDIASLTPYGRTLLDCHVFLATFIWVYLGGHFCMALLHWCLPRRFVAYPQELQ